MRQVATHDVFKAFCQFAEIKNIDDRDARATRDVREFLIHFVALSDDAKKQLSSSPISIDNRNFDVAILANDSSRVDPIWCKMNYLFTCAPLTRYTTDNVNELLALVPDQQSPKNIMNALPDKCLLDIFERLFVGDLLEVAHVCQHFNVLAVHVYRTKHIQDTIDSTAKYSFMQTLTAFERFFSTFAPTKVELYARFNVDIMSYIVAEHCPELQELDLKCVRLTTQAIATLRPLLPRLKMLRTSEPSMCRDSDAAFWQLERLYIHFFSDWRLPNIEMPSLHTLTLDGIRFNDDFLFSAQFLPELARLRSFRFVSCTLYTHQLVMFLRMATNIETLVLEKCNIETWGRDDDTITALRRLKSCTIKDCTESTEKFLLLRLNEVPIEHLRLCSFNAARTVNDIHRLTSLTSLHLLDFSREVVDDISLMRLLDSLHQLRELYINEGLFTLAGIRRLLGQARPITKLDIGLSRMRPVPVKTGDLEEISRLIAARPQLRVKVEVRRRCMPVSIIHLTPNTG